MKTGTTCRCSKKIKKGKNIDRKSIKKLSCTKGKKKRRFCFLRRVNLFLFFFNVSIFKLISKTRFLT